MRVRAWRLETQSLHERPVQVRPLEQREIGLDPRERFDHRHDENRKQHAGERVQHAKTRRRQDVARRQVECKTDGRGGCDVCSADDEDPAICLISCSNLTDRDRRDRAADEADEQRVRSPKDALTRDERRQDHSGNDADPPLEQCAENNGRQCHGNQLGMHRLQQRHGGAANQHKRGRCRHGQQPSEVLVDLRAADDDRQSKQRDEKEVEQNGADDSTARAFAAVPAVDRIVERAELFVLLASDHLVRANDLFTGQHVVLRDRNTAARFFATQLRGGSVGDDRGMEERREQTDVQRIADGGTRIRVNQPGAADERRECCDAVRQHASILARAAHDDGTVDGVHRARARHADAEPAIEHTTERQHERGAAPFSGEIRRLRNGELHSPTRRRALHS